MTNELTYFPVTGYFNTAIGGALQTFDTTVVFTPRVPANFTALISDLDLGNDNSGSSALAFPPEPVSTIGGVLTYSLLSNSAPVAAALAEAGITQLWYDVQFTKVTLGYQIQNFSFLAPTDGTAVCVTDPDLDRYQFGGTVPVVSLPPGVTAFGVELIGATNLAAAQSLLGTYSGNTDSIFDYGAKVDGQLRQDATISSGSLNVVSCSGYQFQASDVGKTIIIGDGASSTPYQAHVTTIASLSGNNAVLTAAAGNAVSGAFVAWGTDDGAAWTAALTAMAGSGASGVAQLIMPAGISICGHAISLTPTINIECFSLRGSSVGTSRIICTNAGGFLTLNLNSTSDGGRESQTDFADLNIATAIAGATTALTVESAYTPYPDYQREFTAQRIQCTGFDTASGYWINPIQALGVARPFFPMWS